MGRNGGNHLGLWVVAVLVGMVVAAPPATAETATVRSAAVGSATLGSAAFTRGGVRVDVPEQAACAVDGQTTATAGEASGAGVRFLGGTSTCATEVDAQGRVASIRTETVGSGFELTALEAGGGPRIALGEYRVACRATPSGTGLSWGITGMSGLGALPGLVPGSHRHPIRAADGRLLATAVFNETTKAGSGAVSLTALRLRFEPDSGAQGEVVVGRATCAATR